MGFQHIAKKQIIRIAGTVFYPPLLAGELSRDGGCTVAISDGYVWLVVCMVFLRN